MYMYLASRCHKENNWITYTKKIISQNGQNTFWMTQHQAMTNHGKFKSFINTTKQIIIDSAKQELMGTLENPNGKLRTYNKLKNEWKFEPYLNNVTNSKHRIALTKLRISNHKLGIETGRYTNPYQHPKQNDFVYIATSDR